MSDADLLRKRPDRSQPMYKIERKQEDFLQVTPVPSCGQELTEEIRTVLIEEAISILGNSYAPYSHYNVAAAVLMSSGRIYTGVNIESALLSNTICAERNAIFHAAAQGERKIIAIAIVGGPDSGDAEDILQHDYCTPCGVCRQTMMDFADPQKMTIICARSVTDYREWTLREMLPESFGPEDIEKK